jgi:hypothetical protein
MDQFQNPSCSRTLCSSSLRLRSLATTVTRIWLGGSTASAIYPTKWFLRSNFKRIIRIRLDMATSGVASDGREDHSDDGY